MTNWNLPPQEIERLSWEIIEAEAPPHAWPPDAWRVIRRMIHTTADFDWVANTRIHPLAMERGVQAIKAGATVYTDTRMAQAGISAKRLAPYGCQVRCLMDDPQVARLASEQGTTRAVAAVDLALPELTGAIYVVGNAPTALYRLLQHIETAQARPALVVGLPVGFVNAAEAKQALAQSSQPFITAQGRKGGSAVAACVINALAELCGEG
ncbi:MAG: precorrin-8X methylmutase [Desulfarculus sp.]|nr:precorrin-8X methylmutase [Desulfarculus sp.]